MSGDVTARPVTGADARVAAGPGLPFNGRRYTDRGELARALVADWDLAARFFFARGETGEAWRTLRSWLSGLDDGPDADAAGRIELVDTHLTGPRPADVKLLHLVRWLDPALPPHFLGRRVTADDLPGLAALASDDRHPDHPAACLIGRALWEHRLLPVLAGFSGTGSRGGAGAGAAPGGTADLAQIDARWRGQAETWNRLAGGLRPQLPPQIAARLPDAGAPGRDEPPVVLLTLLALAARPEATADALAGSAARARAAVTEPVPWFGWLAEAAGSDPIRLLAVVRTAPDAAIEAEAVTRDRTTAAQRSADRQRWWQEQERTRLAGRSAAVRRAVLWSLPLLALWSAGTLLIDALFTGSDSGSGTRSVGGLQRSPGVPLAALLTAALLTWLVEAGGEVLLARSQGTDYLPYGPWSWLSRLLSTGGRGLSAASRAVSGTAQRSGGRGCGFLLIAGIVPVLLVLILFAALTSLASLLWLLALLAAATGHAIGAGVRLHHWRQAHDAAKRQALEGAM